MHSSPKQLNITGCDLIDEIMGLSNMSTNVFDCIIRRLLQSNSSTNDVVKIDDERYFMESDLAVSTIILYRNLMYRNNDLRVYICSFRFIYKNCFFFVYDARRRSVYPIGQFLNACLYAHKSVVTHTHSVLPIVQW